MLTDDELGVWKNLEWPIDFSDGLARIAWVEIEEEDDGEGFYARSLDVKGFVVMGRTRYDLLDKIIPDCMSVCFQNANQRVTVLRAARLPSRPIRSWNAYPFIVIPKDPLKIIDDE